MHTPHADGPGADLPRFGLWIDGAFRQARAGGEFASIDPATEQPWALVADGGAEDVADAVAAARRAFREGGWRLRTPAERADVLDAIALACQEAQDRLVDAEVKDAGGTVRKGNTADVTATAETFQYYAELLRSTPEETADEHFVPVPSRNIIRKEPAGVVGAIVPFNFPLAAAAWKVAPAIAAGCSVVLKPSPLTPVTALMLGEICTQAGVPAGVVNVVVGASHAVGEAIVAHPEVDQIAFTGSTEVGQRIMEACAKTLKRITLELGGKSPNIVLDDAVIDTAARGALFGTFFHQGQICESGTRVLVHRSVHDALVERMIEGASKLRLGDPFDFDTTLGPLISEQQRARVERYVALAKEEGAVCVHGGRRPPGLDRGYFYEPTIFIGVDNTMRIAREEVFGPVVVVIPFDTDEEALAIANDSAYGLGAAVWSASEERALALARRIDAGTVWVNDYHLLSPRFPFGGYKKSGFGRELGPQGLELYQQIKHIHVGQSTGPDDKYYMAMLLD